MQRLKIAFASILCAAVVFAQQPAPAVPTFSESVEVRVLNLDLFGCRHG